MSTVLIATPDLRPGDVVRPVLSAARLLITGHPVPWVSDHPWVAAEIADMCAAPMGTPFVAPAIVLDGPPRLVALACEGWEVHGRERELHVVERP